MSTAFIIAAFPLFVMLVLFANLSPVRGGGEEETESLKDFEAHEETEFLKDLEAHVERLYRKWNHVSSRATGMATLTILKASFGIDGEGRDFIIRLMDKESRKLAKQIVVAMLLSVKGGGKGEREDGNEEWNEDLLTF